MTETAHPAGRRPRLLDLFCGAGGAGMGYYRAGFDVVGIDLKPQPRYPFPFRQADALEFASMFWPQFDAIHASPPCQDYSSAMRHRQSSRKPRLIETVQSLCEAIGLPWVIENVVGAPIPRRSNLFGEHGTLVCGSMVGLDRVWRHRLFKASFPLLVRDCSHKSSPFEPVLHEITSARWPNERFDARLCESDGS